MIKQLEQNLINKIAAGEVVERPLSVVKELVENAIDAGATSITAEIKDGGLTTVRITDNGGGIAAGDVPLDFARHATSKISTFDDLMEVETLGFRGEALSSIGAVAQVELITKTRDSVLGKRIEVHGGKLISEKDIGCIDGTTLVVSNLFYNVPARRKFLKKPATEAGYISQCLEKLAIGNPALTLRYINNGQIIFQTNGNNDLKTAILNVYGRETATKMIAVDATKRIDDLGESGLALHLSGLIGKPEIARGNRKHGSFFINNRYVESSLLTRAVESAMRTMLPGGRFPVYVLSLSLPPTSLDVNVHPNKLDVRFANENEVFSFIEGAVRDSLEESNLIPTVKFGRREETIETPEPEQFKLPTDRVLQQQNPYALPFSLREERGSGDIVSERFARPRSALAWQERTADDGNVGSDRSPRHQRSDRACLASDNIPAPPLFDSAIIGRLWGTYWLATMGESLYMIDQHAAHERVMYEEILKKSQAEAVHAQPLIAPVTLRLTPREKDVLRENREIFSRFGFDISDEENPQILSVPFLMKGPLTTGFFTDLLDKMDNVGFVKNSPYTHKTELVAMAACKAAVKAGDFLGETEARALISQLLGLDNPFTCPHGRPTIIEITRSEIERRFKR
jgi:DNA mismatch repair protein MutL